MTSGRSAGFVLECTFGSAMKLLRRSAICSLQITRSGDVQSESQAYTTQETRRRWLGVHSSCQS